MTPVLFSVLVCCWHRQQALPALSPVASRSSGLLAVSAGWDARLPLPLWMSRPWSAEGSRHLLEAMSTQCSNASMLSLSWTYSSSCPWCARVLSCLPSPCVSGTVLFQGQWKQLCALFLAALISWLKPSCSCISYSAIFLTFAGFFILVLWCASFSVQLKWCRSLGSLWFLKESKNFGRLKLQMSK